MQRINPGSCLKDVSGQERELVIKTKLEQVLLREMDKIRMQPASNAGSSECLAAQGQRLKRGTTPDWTATVPRKKLGALSPLFYPAAGAGQ